MSAPTESQLIALARLVDKPTSPDERKALQRYVDMLVGPGADRGLIGPREADRVWERHILNCAALAPLLASGATVADVGAGAGLPGIVLGIVRPDLSVTLIEPLLRRAEFLAAAVVDLELGDRLTVVRERAEAYRGAAVDVVVARAVAPLDRLAGWSLPLLRPGGTLLAVKGRRAHIEVTQHRADLIRLGARCVDVIALGADQLTEPTTVVVVAT